MILLARFSFLFLENPVPDLCLSDPRPDQKLQKKSYTTFYDDGYVSNSDIHAFPTTWFLDTTGKKAFEKKGWSEKLLEEFSWRIEEVK